MMNTPEYMFKQRLLAASFHNASDNGGEHADARQLTIDAAAIAVQHGFTAEKVDALFTEARPLVDPAYLRRLIREARGET